MLQDLDFMDQKKIFGIVMRKDPNKGPQNWQKYILQQKNFVAGKNLPYMQHRLCSTKMAGAGGRSGGNGGG